VINNSSYGTIRTHQEDRFAGRGLGTDLRNPDFPAYARSFGAGGELVATTADFPAAFERALAADVPYVLELRVDAGLTLART
jgi:acetolactate synthase-1/2/3 large subunit